MLIGIPTLATVGVGSAYAGTSKTWKVEALNSGSWEGRADGDPWVYSAPEVPGEWKDYFECCCKDGSTCTSCDTGNDGACPDTGDNQCEWKLIDSKKQDIKNQCERVGSRVSWALNKSSDNNTREYQSYRNVCLKQKSSGSR